MTAKKSERIALDIINGNRNDAREALKRAHGKTIVLDVLDELTQYEGVFEAQRNLRRLLNGG